MQFMRQTAPVNLTSHSTINTVDVDQLVILELSWTPK